MTNDIGTLLKHVRPENLRDVPNRLNTCNSVGGRYKLRTSSRFIGVSWQARGKRWRAQIRLADLAPGEGTSRRVWLGDFDDELDAVLIYDEAARQLHEGRARFNLDVFADMPELTERVRAILQRYSVHQIG